MTRKRRLRGKEVALRGLLSDQMMQDQKQTGRQVIALDCNVMLMLLLYIPSPRAFQNGPMRRHNENSIECYVHSIFEIQSLSMFWKQLFVAICVLSLFRRMGADKHRCSNLLVRFIIIASRD